MLELYFIKEAIEGTLDKSFYELALPQKQLIANIVTDYCISLVKEYNARKEYYLLEELPWGVLVEVLPFQTKLETTDMFLDIMQPSSRLYEKFLDYASNEWLLKTCQQELDMLKTQYHTFMTPAILKFLDAEDLRFLLKQLETEAQLGFMTEALYNHNIIKAFDAFLESPIFEKIKANPDLADRPNYRLFCLYAQAFGLYDFGFSAIALASTNVSIIAMELLYDLENGSFSDGQMALYFIESTLTKIKVS